tara:strand:+ start:3302 stop:4165 length:864 start_codon:yes stop_codon:yes gene_type:complete
MRLYYILSSGRSGSTILETLMNSSKEVFTLGEFHLLFLESDLNAKCGCGDYLNNDIIWSDIIKKFSSSRILFSKYRKTFSSKTGHYGKVIRINKLFQILFNLNTSESLGYSELNYKILIHLNDKLKDNKSYVDSSKDVYRFYDLYKSNLFDIYPIHLYKCSQSFVYSMIKSSKGPLRWFLLIRFSLRWLIENTLIKLILRKTKNKLVISYGELIENYSEVITSMYKKFDVCHSGKFTLYTQINHGIAGNISRNQSREIFIDDKYKYGLSHLEKQLITMLTFNLKSFK